MLIAYYKIYINTIYIDIIYLIKFESYVNILMINENE